MKRAVWIGSAWSGSPPRGAYVAYVAVSIERQSSRDEAQPADVIMVLGAAEYSGRPSPVLRARLDHALELYKAGSWRPASSPPAARAATACIPKAAWDGRI